MDANGQRVTYIHDDLSSVKEVFDKYNKILQWGRKHPTRFIEDFFKI